MADQAIFIGWGDTVSGREQKAIEVFNNSVGYWGKLQGDGKIDSMDIVFLTPHGGDLAGFAMLRGSQEQLDAVTADDEYNGHLARAASWCTTSARCAPRSTRACRSRWSSSRTR